MSPRPGGDVGNSAEFAVMGTPVETPALTPEQVGETPSAPRLREVGKSAFMRIIREHPTLMLTLLYLALTFVGVVHDFFFYLYFKINVLDYSETGDFLLLGFEQCAELLDFLRKPANFRITMIAAARLLGAIAAEERPILRAPIIEPVPVLCNDGLAQALERVAFPCSIRAGFARFANATLQSQLPGEYDGAPCVTTRGELEAIVGQPLIGRTELGEQVDES